MPHDTQLQGRKQIRGKEMMKETHTSLPSQRQARRQRFPFKCVWMNSVPVTIPE